MHSKGRPSGGPPQELASPLSSQAQTANSWLHSEILQTARYCQATWQSQVGKAKGLRGSSYPQVGVFNSRPSGGFTRSKKLSSLFFKGCCKLEAIHLNYRCWQCLQFWVTKVLSNTSDRFDRSHPRGASEEKRLRFLGVPRRFSSLRRHIFPKSNAHRPVQLTTGNVWKENVLYCRYLQK